MFNCDCREVVVIIVIRIQMERTRSTMKKALLNMKDYILLGCMIFLFAVNLSGQNTRLVLPTAHYYGVDKMAVSLDSSLLVSSDVNGTLIVWNRLGGRELYRAFFDRPILSICFVSDNHFIVGLEDTIALILPETGQKYLHPYHSTIKKMQFIGGRLISLSRDSLLQSSVVDKDGRLINEINLAKQVIDFDLQYQKLAILTSSQIITADPSGVVISVMKIPEFRSAPTMVRKWNNDSLMITSTEDGSLLSWDLIANRIELIHKFDISVNQIICDHKYGHIYASSNDFIVMQFDIISKSKKIQFFSDYCMDMVMTDDMLYASCYNGNIYVFDKQLLRIGAFRTGIEKAINYQIMQNGQAVIAYESGDVYLMNLKDSSRRLILQSRHRVSSITENAELQALYISCYDSAVYLYRPSQSITNIRFGSPVISLRFEPKTQKLLVVLLDSIIILDHDLDRVCAILAGSTWFVNQSRTRFYIGGFSCIYKIDCITNSIIKIKYGGLNDNHEFLAECFESKLDSSLYYISYSGELWRLSGDSHTLLFNVGKDLHHVFQSQFDDQVYLVTGDNKVYRVNPEISGEAEVVFWDSTLDIDESWSIDQNRNGEFLISSGNRILVFSANWVGPIWSYDMSDRVCLPSDSRRSASFINGSDTIFAISYNGNCFWGSFRNAEHKSVNYLLGITHKKIKSTLKVYFDSAVYQNYTYKLFNKGKATLNYLDLESGEWLVYDSHYRFDGTESAIGKLYLTCGLDELELNHIRDSLWIPGLAKLYSMDYPIRINDKLAPKLEQLNICNLTPVVESIGNDSLYRFRIIPRQGGLGYTEIYINGNLTYQYAPSRLEKRVESNKTVYYLTLNKDSLKDYLTSGNNPLEVKSMAKGSSIYSRGETISLFNIHDSLPSPKFFGVFIGVNDYGNPDKSSDQVHYTNLDYAEKDALSLASATETAVRELFGDECYIYNLVGSGDHSPTRENLKKTLEEIGRKAKASDVLYVFFAGHGDFVDYDGQEHIRFMLKDADKLNKRSGSFGIEELNEWCNAKSIRAQKRVFVFDACHSGKIINEFTDKINRGDYNSDRIRQLDKLRVKNGMMILAASAENQFAYEDPSLNQGVLTYHMLQSIQYYHGDSLLYVKKWFDEAVRLVEEYSRTNNNRQEPQNFGDGRFYIGVVNQKVIDSINIQEPRLKIGSCIFSDPIGDAEKAFPGIEQEIFEEFNLYTSRGDWIISENSSNAYNIVGTYLLSGKKLVFRYRIFLGKEQISDEAIILSFPSKQQHNEIIKSLIESIYLEVQKEAK